MKSLLRNATAVAGLAVALAALPAAVRADDAKPLAGQSITVLLPSGQSPTLAADFEKETGIKVDLQMLSWDDIRPKLITGLIAGTPPADVTEFDWSWTGQFGAADWYEDLTPLIDAETVKDIAGSSIFTVDGKLLGVPYSNDFRVMLINRKHFTDAGITETPKTLDELVAAAKTIKEKGITTYPIGLPLSTSEGTSTSWYLLTKAFGGELFDKDFKPLFTTPDSAGYKALAFEIQALKDGLVDPASTGLKDSQINESMFGQGQTSIMISGEPGRIAQFADPAKSKVAGQIEAILVATESGKTRSYGLLEALGIPKASEHKEAALAFIKWMTSKDYQIKNYSVGVLPTRTSALKQLNDDGKLLSGAVLVEQAPTVGALFPQGTPTWYPQFSSAVSNAINQAAKDEISVADAVKSIADETAKAQQQ